MVELWFAIIALMLTLYVVLDGYDFGAGILHLFVARTDAERRQVLNAIGPYWDGNEVWLIATGTTLFAVFPRVLASGLSGFYFAIFLLLWCLILRGAAIEFRSHVEEPLWRNLWDAVWCGASALLALFFGAALGNLIRGLPLDSRGWFGLALFTDWSARPPVGILDWYTVSAGVFAVGHLALHGANYLALRTDGEVQARSRRIAGPLFIAVAVAWPLVTVATVAVFPELLPAFLARPFAWLGFLLALGGAIAVMVGQRRAKDLVAFIGSTSWIAGLLVATAACLFPIMLRAVPDAAHSITAHAAANDESGLRIGLTWWLIGFPLAIAYHVIVLRIHRGKVRATDRPNY
ncbi:MAG TPA: cytochrome d ubiquinol oxidase subunit II [Candidatus Eisenbacteria bacterium]|nr:cytochrome d ubiquinol oxidase subunit II [Candidatus Eisenbacteria bacterium]